MGTVSEVEVKLMGYEAWEADRTDLTGKTELQMEGKENPLAWGVGGA